MVFASLMRDNLVLIKQDGRRHEGLSGSVQKNQITLLYDGLLVEAGDEVVRVMSNGSQEMYRVVDPGFREAYHMIPARYTMEVERIDGARQRSSVASNVIINIQGDNARVNQNSVDNSQNNVIHGRGCEPEISIIRDELKRLSLTESELRDLMDKVDLLEVEVRSAAPRAGIVRFVLDALPRVESIVKAGASILEIVAKSIPA